MKIFSKSLLSLILGSVLISSVAHADEASVRSILNAKFPNIAKFNPNIKPIAVAGLYQITVNNSISYTNENVDFFLVGGELLVSDGSIVKNITIEEQAKITQNTDKPIGNAIAKTVDGQVIDDPNSVQLKTDTAAKTPINDLSLEESQKLIESKRSQIDTTGKVQTPDPRANVSKVFSGLPFEKAAKIVYGKGERVIAVFADPDCPYCQKLEKAMSEKGGDLNLTVYIMPWPLTIHPYANQKADYLWCENDKGAAWKSWMDYAANSSDDSEVTWNSWIKDTGRPNKATCDVESPREEIRAIAQKYSFRYTPTIMFQNGMVFNGSLSIEQLENALQYNKNNPKVAIPPLFQ